MSEPIAWMHKTIPSWTSTFIHPETEPDEWLPLYTNQVRELTNEEVADFTHRMVLCCQVHPSSADINVLGLVQIVEEIRNK